MVLKQIRIVIFLLILINSKFNYSQNILFVPDDYTSIQSAINNAKNFDTIVVKRGTYYENLNINKPIFLTSEWLYEADSSSIKNTIIDGQTNSVIVANDCYSGFINIVGFTIRNGEDGIYTNSNINIYNNIIEKCIDGIDYETGAYSTCKYNIIRENMDDAIDCDGSINVLIEDNSLINNLDDGMEIRLHEFQGNLLTYIIRRNNIFNNGEDGIQIIDYPDISDRVLYIEFNNICSNSMAGIGMMGNGNTIENYEGHQIPEPIYIINNTIDNNLYGITGGANTLLINNIISNSLIGLKNTLQNSKISNSCFFGNDTNFVNCNNGLNIIYEVVDFNGKYKIDHNSICYNSGVGSYYFNLKEYIVNNIFYFGDVPDIGAHQVDGAIEIGPFIIYTKNNDLSLNWKLKEHSLITLSWGTDSLNLSNIITIDSNKELNNFVFNELAHDQKYYFNLNENNTDHRGSFYYGLKSVSDFSFFVYGDTQTNIGSFNRVAQAINNIWEEDYKFQTFAIHLGDWNSIASDHIFSNEFFNRMYIGVNKFQNNIPLLGVRGNHDNDINGGPDIFKKYFHFNYQNNNDCYYSLNNDLALFVFIDQYTDFSINSDQYNWVKKTLENSQSFWKFIIMHEPMYSCGPHPNNIEFQSIFQPIFEQNNVDICFAGHNHNYSHNNVNNIHYLTLGGGGAPLYDVSSNCEGFIKSNKILNFSKIHLTEYDLNIDVLSDKSKLIDSISISKPNTDEPDSNFLIVPNIVNEYFDIILKQVLIGSTSIKIYNTLGQQVYEKNIHENKSRIRIKTTMLQKGIHFIKVGDNSYSMKFLKL